MTTEPTPARDDKFVPVYAFPHTVAMVSTLHPLFNTPGVQADCKCGWQGEHRSFYPDALYDANAHVQGECRPQDRRRD
jgi:hypothetical protein